MPQWADAPQSGTTLCPLASKLLPLSGGRGDSGSVRHRLDRTYVSSPLADRDRHCEVSSLADPSSATMSRGRYGNVPRPEDSGISSQTSGWLELVRIPHNCDVLALRKRPRSFVSLRPEPR